MRPEETAEKITDPGDRDAVWTIDAATGQATTWLSLGSRTEDGSQVWTCMGYGYNGRTTLIWSELSCCPPGPVYGSRPTGAIPRRIMSEDDYAAQEWLASAGRQW